MFGFFFSGVPYQPAWKIATMRQLMEHYFLSGTDQGNVLKGCSKCAEGMLEMEEAERTRRKEKKKLYSVWDDEFVNLFDLSIKILLDSC